MLAEPHTLFSNKLMYIQLFLEGQVIVRSWKFSSVVGLIWHTLKEFNDGLLHVPHLSCTNSERDLTEDAAWDFVMPHLLVQSDAANSHCPPAFLKNAHDFCENAVICHAAHLPDTCGQWRVRFPKPITHSHPFCYACALQLEDCLPFDGARSPWWPSESALQRTASSALEGDKTVACLWLRRARKNPAHCCHCKTVLPSCCCSEAGTIHLVCGSSKCLCTGAIGTMNFWNFLYKCQSTIWPFFIYLSCPSRA